MTGDRSRPGAARAVRGFLAFATVGLPVLALGWLWWQGPRQSSVRGHWAAVARGREALRRGRPDLAFQAVSEVRDEAPGSGEAMTVAGLALFRLGEYRGARLALERALKLQPESIRCGRHPRRIEPRPGQRRAVGSNSSRWPPGSGREMSGSGSSWARSSAISATSPGPSRPIERALDLNPDDREASIGLIRCLIATDQPDQAEPWLTRARERYPDDPKVLGLAARGAFDTNRLDEAIALAGRRCAREPGNLDALLNARRARVVQARWEQALPDAERVRAASPDDLGALQLLQKIQTKLGLTERAAATQAERSAGPGSHRAR